MRTLHNHMDVNKDGVISYEDFTLLGDRFSNLGHLTPEAQREFKRLLNVICKLTLFYQHNLKILLNKHIYSGNVGRTMGRNKSLQSCMYRKISRGNASRTKRQNLKIQIR